MYIATPFISTVVWSAKLKVASAGEAKERKTSPQVRHDTRRDPHKPYCIKRVDNLIVTLLVTFHAGGKAG